MPPREQLAARLRERGNALFRAGNYSEAASVYTAGLNQLPRGHGAPVTPMHLTLDAPPQPGRMLHLVAVGAH